MTDKNKNIEFAKIFNTTVGQFLVVRDQDKRSKPAITFSVYCGHVVEGAGTATKSFPLDDWDSVNESFETMDQKQAEYFATEMTAKYKRCVSND